LQIYWNLALDVSTSKALGNAGVSELAKRLPMGLRNLQLIAGPAVGDAGMCTLAHCLPRQLERLLVDVYSSSASGACLEALARGLPPGLQQLSVYYSRELQLEAAARILRSARPLAISCGQWTVQAMDSE